MNNTEKIRPPTWQEFKGNQASIARIRRLLELERLPHALLFSGPEGIGKRLAAEIMAAQLLRTERGLLEAHPDYARLSPDGTRIRIGQVREIQRLSGLAPVRGPFRVCLVEPADAMDAPAANCLLKILEEPPPGLFFALITAFPHSLLPTIRSRTAHIRFNPPTDLQVTDPAQLANRDLAFEFLRNLNKPGLEWLWPVVGGLEGMETGRILDIIRQWIFVLRDLAVLSTGRDPAELFNSDRRTELVDMAADWNISGLGAVIRLAENTRQHLQRNANTRLMLESLLIRSADLYWGGKENADHRGSPV